MTTTKSYQFSLLDALYLFPTLLITIKVIPPLFARLTGSSSSSVSLPPIPGPPREGLFGVTKLLNSAEDAAVFYEKWTKQYGQVYKIPGVFWGRVVIVDPKANAHLFSKDTYGYGQNKVERIFFERFFGRGLIWAEGDTHRRQRKSLSPAFSNTAIRRLTSVFYDCAYKAKAAWDAQLELEPDAVIEVQKWMNCISLDSIGIAGFSHDFESLAGVQSPVTEVFESFETGHKNIFQDIVFIFSPIFPILLRVPTSRNIKLANLRGALRKIADELLENTRKEKSGSVRRENAEDKSIIGILMKAEDAGVDQEEIVAQMNVLLLAGYETTSISLTWAFIELARAPEKQQRLRDELASFTSGDPTWEQLTNGLPYLDAVVHEVLRLHPAVPDLYRVATEDDVLPLSKPITPSTGGTITSLVIPKGTNTNTPVHYINRSEEYWGPDAKEFVPERWLDESSLAKAKEISGYRHILTFSDGPRLCLGKSIALTEFKAVLSVLIRSYEFELPQGKDTKIEIHRALLQRPKVAGQSGAKVPMKVRRVD